VNANAARATDTEASRGIYAYDSLLMATGGLAFVPPIKGVEKRGVFTLRSMEDAINMKEFSKEVNQAILIGGGLVGSGQLPKGRERLLVSTWQEEI